MNHASPNSTQTLLARTAVVDAARRRAAALRQEAMHRFFSAVVRAPVRWAALATGLLRQRAATTHPHPSTRA